MSYHIIHILTHASRLTVDRGCLVCNAPAAPEHRVPLQDICAVIVAARGVSFSADSLSTLLTHHATVLHCNEKYQPIGKTVNLSHIVHAETFEKQISQNADFNNAVWKILLNGKLKNQAHVLTACHRDNPLCIEGKIRNDLDESNAARLYWKAYFSLYGKPPAIREHRDAKHPINQMLNYGYAVLAALVHRSILAHGLLPTLGIHHRFRFRADPMVYDLMEPLRPVVDLLLATYKMGSPKFNMQDWVHEIAKALTMYMVEINGRRTKLLYSLDIYTASIAEAFTTGSTSMLKIPTLCSNQK